MRDTIRLLLIFDASNASMVETPWLLGVSAGVMEDSDAMETAWGEGWEGGATAVGF